MEYFGSYHADVRRHAPGICDAPHISKGQMTISGFETASEPKLMVLVHGRMRNRAELAGELNCAPYASLAQIVLSAYRKWGEFYAEHIQGPLMSCVADVENDRMLITRDRMGETGLFYCFTAGRFVFADHPDMILKSALLEPVIDRDAACELFGMGPARTPGRTPLRDLKTLEPGCQLVCCGGKLAHRRYFELSAREHGENEKTTIEHTRFLLEQAVSEILPLHPGCMLSGGLDSTALTALLSLRIGRLKSFSVDYRDNSEDFVPTSLRPELDAPYIHMAAREFGTQHRITLLEQEALADALGNAVRARGFPGMADIDASMLLFARDIVRTAPAVVSGECGDEVFGGYPWFAPGAGNDDRLFPWSGSLELRESILRREVAQKLRLRDYISEAGTQALEGYDVSGTDDPGERRLMRMQRLCFDFFMPNLQERARTMCGACGLQVLTPLCDERLVAYVYSVPWRMKRLGGMEKGLFREAVRDLLPERLCMRKKSPYPKTCSAVYSSIIRARIRALCADHDAPVWQLVDSGTIEKLASGLLSPTDTPWYGQLMAGPQMLAYILQINCWMKERGISVEL